jgi:hypothetical protein
MKVRSIAAIVVGGLIAAALIVIPVRAASAGDAVKSSGQTAATKVGQDFIAGFDTGLYRVSADGSKAAALWQGGEVKKILRCSVGWYFLTSKGILFSADLASFVDRSTGLPVKTYKVVKDGKKEFSSEVQDLKDLSIDSKEPARLLTCTKDSVYYSKDGGEHWENLGTPISTTGLKAASFAPYPGTGEAAVWASHPIKGVFARRLDDPKSGWAPANDGLADLPGTTSVEEVADLALSPDSAQLWASNSFLPRIYRYDDAKKSFNVVYADKSEVGTIESLEPLPDGDLRFVSEKGIQRLNPKTGKIGPDEEASQYLAAALKAQPDDQLLSLSWEEGGSSASLSELWLASFRNRKPYRAAAENRQALYLATGFMVHPETREKYFGLMKERKLNAVVVDMKDDFGRLRFEPKTPLLKTMGKTASPMDVESFVADAKARGVYLIARVVVFKDEVVYNYAGGKYAVWDNTTKAPWRGYKIVRTALVAAAPTAPAAAPQGGAAASGPAPEATSSPAPALPKAQKKTAPQFASSREEIKEYWVDPYSEDVWAYNVAIANEIISRGFNEVQFDYIRFPTDGANIDQASFRYRDPGMDKESALASFLRFARENIAAPISIDIYGANGWYRSGVRTGQDVELLAKYVDAICPMFYPSHFEQTFLAGPPAEERPYRIYRIGDFRTNQIARGKVVVRPYVQAFYMNVSYDRAYYNLDYVKREVAGVRDGVNLGMTFWNNGGRYDDIPVLNIGADGKLLGLVSPIPAQIVVSTKKPASTKQASQVKDSTKSEEGVPDTETSSGLLD